MRNGNLEKAIVDYTAAEKLGFRDACVYCNRGFTRFTIGDEGLALADLRKAVEIDPKQDISQADLAEFL